MLSDARSRRALIIMPGKPRAMFAMMLMIRPFLRGKSSIVVATPPGVT